MDLNIKDLYSELKNDKIKINRNNNPIKMNLFLSFLKIKINRSHNHLGIDTGWTKLFNEDFDLIIGGGIVSGVEYLDSIQFGNKLQNAYNNYVNPFYLFNIITKEGKLFFIDYYKNDIDELLDKHAKEIEYYTKKLNIRNDIYKSILNEVKDLRSMARQEAEHNV